MISYIIPGERVGAAHSTRIGNIVLTVGVVSLILVAVWDLLLDLDRFVVVFDLATSGYHLPFELAGSTAGRE